MTNIDFEGIELKNLITHWVGNKMREEGIDLSKAESAIDEETQLHLLNYFLMPIKQEEFYSFVHTVKLEMNEVYTVVKELFANAGSFIELSQNIAKLLYEQSIHPKVKEGKLNVCLFSNIRVDENNVDAIGIFKSETDVPFLKMQQENSGFNIEHEYGFEIKGIDKGCIILNTNEEEGYKALIIDKANRSAEAQYWKDDFLNVKPVSNEFHQTNEFLSITKNYITKELPQEFEIAKPDQIELLNRSVEYFKTNESFDKDSFEGEVFQDDKLIESFQNFHNVYQQENEVEVGNNFDISRTAVKKQSRVFKSVIKLDKNFHIYVHGNRELIEQGVDDNGKKYYKIYYDEEK
jgi:hypothetical protein